MFLMRPRVSLIVRQVVEFIPKDRYEEVFTNSRHVQLLAGFRVFVFSGANVEGLSFAVVGSHVPLVVFRFRAFIFGAGAAMFRVPRAGVMVLIGASNGRCFVRRQVRFFADEGVVHPRARVDSFGRAFGRLVMSTFEGTLVLIVGVVVVVGRAREGSFCGGNQGLHYEAPPLFFHVSLS